MSPAAAPPAGAETRTWLCVVTGAAALEHFVAQLGQAWARGEQVSYDRITFRPDPPTAKPPDATAEALATVFAQADERRDVQEPLRALARQCGWLTYHAFRSDKSETGFPDLCFVRERLPTSPPYLVFVEAKRQRTTLTPAQERWRRALEVLERVSGGVIAYRLARPSTRHEVEALLVGPVERSPPAPERHDAVERSSS
jgi:hypothetical protein